MPGPGGERCRTGRGHGSRQRVRTRRRVVRFVVGALVWIVVIVPTAASTAASTARAVVVVVGIVGTVVVIVVGAVVATAGDTGTGERVARGTALDAGASRSGIGTRGTLVLTAAAIFLAVSTTAGPAGLE
jgi:hypothetical protein